MYKQIGLKLLLTIVAILACIGLYTGFTWETAPDYNLYGVPVLNYHEVNDDKFSPLAMGIGHFEQQMDYLHKNGYHTITPDQLYDYLTKGTALPDKPVLITFDDGYEDNYKNAFPYLRKYNMKATLFVIGDDVGKPNFMTAAQLQEIDKQNIDVQGHTWTHRDMRKLSYQEVLDEQTHVKHYLENLLHKPIYYTAYPCGFTSPTVEAATKAAGYRLAWTVKTGDDKPGQNLYALPRMPVFEGDDAFLSLRLRLHMSPTVTDLWTLRDDLVARHLYWLANFVPLF